MPLEITVGPPVLSINHGHTVLVTELDGQIPSPSERGLYFFDTRLISTWQLYANGVPWELLSSGAITYYAVRIHLANRTIPTEDGDIAPQTLGLVVGRSIADGLHEDFDLTNYGPKAVRFNLEIAIRSDFADIFEVKSRRIVRRGRIVTEWSDEGELRVAYTNRDFRRALVIAVRNSDGICVSANGRLSFDVAIEPGGSWHTCLHYRPEDGERHFDPPPECIADAERSSLGRALDEWRATVATIRTGNEEFYRFCQRSVEDMAALRLPIEGTDMVRFVPAAGVPWFMGLFGRDSLIAALQTSLIYPDFMEGALDVLGRLQATEVDEYRDAEPGKILHEVRHGELARLRLIPHTPYYGTADATPLYLVALHVAWRCTGNQEMVERLLPVAERCLEWIDRCGDRDGDGFQEYQTRSPVGYENQGWKDAGDAVVDPDGAQVRGPKALCELQGYVFDAWVRMAHLYDHLGRGDRAEELRAKARELYRRFDEAFWDEEAGFYAYCLDGEKRKVLTIASNPGHLLWSGIVPRARAERVVRRFMQPDMWSGWGIRTLSADNPAFNPYSYQNGSVWPHDNGMIALGFKRYGFTTEAAAVAHDISRAAAFFTFHRLPELYAGIERSDGCFPIQYPGANVPQAWAAGSAFSLVQAMLGIQPDAAGNRVYVDPVLPPWLPDLTLTNLRIGQHALDLRFWREEEETRFEVLRGDKDAVARRSYVDGLGLLTRDVIPE